MPASRGWRRPGWGLRAATLAAGALALAPPAGAAMRVGFIDQQYALGHPASFAADARTLDASVVRFVAAWRDVAPSPPAQPRDPADPAYRFEVLDRLVRAAAAVHGAAIVLTIETTPAWARWAPIRPVVAALDTTPGNPNVRVAIPEPNAAASFAYALAIRYSGTYPDPRASGRNLPRVGWFEIGNEPAITLGLFPQCARRGTIPAAFPQSVSHTYGCPAGSLLVAPGLYARQLAASYAAIREAVRRTGASQRVLGGALSNKHTQPFLRELRRVLGPVPPFDALSVHPYDNAPGLGVHDTSVPDGATSATLPTLIALVDRLWPDRRLHFWVTEYGWQTNPPDPLLGVPYADQAAYLREAVDGFAATGRVDAVINYLVVDEAIKPDHPNSWQSGLRDVDGRRKPAFDVWWQLAQFSDPAAAARLVAPW